MTINIVETDLQPYGSLSERSYTDMIVIHHTGEADIDASAEQIDQWHKNRPNDPWTMIGYHYVIRKDGTIERGRPEWAIGSHAYGENYHTIGIHLSGDFMQAQPTQAQLTSCAALIVDICQRYDIPIDRNHIVGHRDLMPTSCPGDNLYWRLDEIIALANGSTLTASAVTQNTSDERIIWDFFKGKGLNDYAVAGLMGNLYAESGLKSNNLENYYERQLGMTDEEYTKVVDYGTYTNFIHDKAGYGLAQWTYYTRKQNLLTFAKAKGKSIGDLNMQLDFLWNELQDYPLVIDKLQDAKSVAEASNAVLFGFERPADQSEAAQYKRASFGQDFYNDFAGLTTIDDDLEESETRYNTLEEVPDWAKVTINKMVNKGFLGGSGAKDDNGNPTELDLSLDMIRVFVINDRAGLYD